MSSPRQPLRAAWAMATGLLLAACLFASEARGQGAPEGGVSAVDPTSFPDGSASAPAVTFLNDPNTGFYRVGADSLGFSAGGTLRLTIDTAAITFALPGLFPAGTVTAPGIGWSADADGTGTGFYRRVANEISVAVNGTLIYLFNSLGISPGADNTFSNGTSANSWLNVYYRVWKDSEDETRGNVSTSTNRYFGVAAASGIAHIFGNTNATISGSGRIAEFDTDNAGTTVGFVSATDLGTEDGTYLKVGDANAGAPAAGDCDADAERGRLSIDTTNNRLYVCNGGTRLWDYVSLTD